MTATHTTLTPRTPGHLAPTYIEVGGVRTRHLTLGDGPPVVLLHGIGRSLEDWTENVQALAATHRVHAIDMIGFGYTDKPDVPYTLAGLARFVRHYLDAVGEHRPVVLIGNSLGGAVAQRFAADHPQRTRALVLVNSAGFGRDVSRVLRACTVPTLGELLARPSRQSARLTVESCFHDPAHASAQRIDAALDLARQPGASRTFLRVLRDLTTWQGAKSEWRADLAGRLARHQLPTLIVWGDRDRVLPAAALETARDLHPHARTHLFTDTGHMPQIERGPQFNAVVLDFLKETP